MAKGKPENRNVAFDVFRNGRRICTAGLKGGTGVVGTAIDWVNRAGGAALSLTVHGLRLGSSDEHLLWSIRRLKIGDELVIRIVDDAEPTRPRARYIAQPRGKNAELASLRNAAKKHGYKLAKTATSRPKSRSKGGASDE